MTTYAYASYACVVRARDARACRYLRELCVRGNIDFILDDVGMSKAGHRFKVSSWQACYRLAAAA